ncbi:serine/threonine protein kinase [Rhodopirellula maiorica SM1]|uniref:non-specific serine/threonine protein kinase n=1 Tax=Rhodopirellula maiorica SM1 TaxID=1265738 RepID=M5R849_9BACT|nr:protein kinase [Rhodopirellula maiorica]EMI15658.1 serine/threonine protein kinase [Rhodopirellula maiorica SM1]
MTVALSEFWARLVRNGVTDAAGCKRYAASYAEKTGGLPPDDAVTLAKYLVKSRVLTQYQAKQLLVSEKTSLRYGGYLQTDAAAAPPLSRWLPVVRRSNEQDADREAGLGVLFRPTPEQLSGGRDQWIAAHAGVTQSSLQSIELDRVDDNIVVFSPLPSGEVLSEVLKKHPRIKAKRACEIGIAICDALTALHASSLWHGDVRADRVWIGKEGAIRLLRDPSGPAVSAMLTNPYSWLDVLESPHAYAAPELADPSTPCSAATDIYSLGCLICRMVIGKMPFQADSVDELMALHASQIPSPIAKAVAAGEAGDPLLRVVAFALAKNPQSRFASIAQFADALRATAAMIDPAASSPSAAATPTAPPIESDTAAAVGESAGASDDAASVTKPPSSTEAKADKPSPSKTSAAKAPPSEPVASEPAAASSVASVAANPSSAVTAQADLAQPDSAETDAAQESASESAPVAVVPAVTTEKIVAPPVAPPESETPPPPPARRRRRKKKSNKAPLILGGLSVMVVMLVIMLIVGGPGESRQEVRKRPRPPIPARIPSVSGRDVDSQPKPAQREPTSVAIPGYQVVDDDRLLWLPPFVTESAAPLEMLPPGPSLIMTVNFAELRAKSSGSNFLDSLAPDLKQLLDQASARAKVPVEQMDRLSIAMHKGTDGWPEISLAVTLQDPVSVDTLTEAWDVSASRTPDGATLYAGDELDSDAYFINDADTSENQVTRFSVSSIARAKEIAENGGANILLPRSMQSLWDATSTKNDLALIVTPNFLFADGRKLIEVGAPRLEPPLKSFLIPDVAAAMCLAHFDEDRLYTEVRLSPSGGIGEATLMQNLKQAIEETPQWARDFVLDAVPDSSWRLLANQLPAMMGFLSNYSRFGVADQAAISNAYLPADAASQITLATLFAINTTGDAGPNVAATTPKKTFTLDELLAEKMSVTFDQESLEFGINIIAEQFAASLPEGTEVPPMRIIGGDLQKMGITQNQQIRGFAKKEMPFRQVLTDLLLGANPDKTATGSHDVKQALIWVVADDPTRPGKKELLITTRQAAEGKYELPAEFVVTP